MEQSLTGSSDKVFPPEIEDAANMYFQKIYTGQLSIADVIALLQGLKNSASAREQDIFACMIHNLFDEYRFFPKYPDKELRVTGVLFGALIQHQLVAFYPLGVALRYVLDALRQDPQSKMFKFGIIALEQFTSRLAEWPQYAEHIVAIPHVAQYHAAIADIAMAALRSRSDAHDRASAAVDAASVAPNDAAAKAAMTAAASGGASAAAVAAPALSMPASLLTSSAGKGPVMPSATVGGNAAAAAAAQSSSSGKAPARLAHPLDIDQLVRGGFDQPSEIDEPPAATADKVFFVFNNISPDNVVSKASELRSVLEARFAPWLANYLVERRLSVEYNFHDLYLSFVDQLAMPGLAAALLGMTYRAVRRLLNGDKVITDIPERALLKNLGAWLGLSTLARNKPLLMRDIKLKELLVHAYERGRMVAVVPFVCKVLGACPHSIVFRPPNPWLMAMLRLLAEIYALPDLKLNLKFEIEVLCKAIDVTLSDVHPSTLLRGRQARITEHDFRPSPGGAAAAAAAAGAAAAGRALAGSGGLGLGLSGSGGGVDGSGSMMAANVAGLVSAEDMRSAAAAAALAAVNGAPGAGDLSRFVIVNPTLSALVQNPQMRRCVPVAIERAVHEIMQPVVERSVTISCITTRELATKDFATEPNELRLRRAAHLMVQNLAGSLAAVTSKEPLRVAMSNHLRGLLAAAAPEQPAAVIEHVVQTLCADNIDWACAVVEQAAMDKATLATDEALAAQYAVRQATRERGQPFWDPALFSGRYPAALPEPLRPVPGGLPPHHARVYDDFSRAARAAQMAIAAGQPPAHAATNAAPALTRDEFGSGGGGGGGAVPVGYAASAPAKAGAAGGANSAGGSSHIGTNGSGASMSGAGNSDVELSTAAVMERYALIADQLEAAVTRAGGASLAALAHDHEVRAFSLQIVALLGLAAARGDAAVSLARRCFVRLFEPGTALQRDVQLAILDGLRRRAPELAARLTQWLVQLDGERRFRRDITIGLVRVALLDNKTLDRHCADVVADQLEGEEQLPPLVRRAAVDFAASLFALGLQDRGSVPLGDFPRTLAALGALAKGPHAPAPLAALVDDVRRSGAMGVHAAVAATLGALPVGGFATATLPDAVTLARDQSLLAPLFDEWLTASTADDMAAIVRRLAAERRLGGGEMTARFFLAFTEIAIARATAAHGAAAHAPIDALARLVVLLVRLQPPAETAAVAALLAGVLAVVVRVLYAKHDAAVVAVTVDARVQATVAAADKERVLADDAAALAVASTALASIDAAIGASSFSARPFHRLLVTLLRELTGGDSEPLTLPTLAAFGNTLLALRPNRVPSFAFAWLELAAHRNFMPRLLLAPARKGWMLFQRLIGELLSFLKPHLARAKLSEPIRQLYNGTLRVLLVLLHDFPEFLSDYHFSLCDAIPPTCVQMRNLVLSAFPRNMRLPDPFTPNLKVDVLPEISQPPRMLSNHMPLLQRVEGGALLNDVNTYLAARQPPSFITTLAARLRHSALLDAGGAAPGTDAYGAAASSLISALTLHIGQQAIAQLQSAAASPLAHSAPMDVFARLMNEFDAESRYLLVNAIANQLRYPNNHTHYFSCALLYLFAEAQREVVQEQITRVLLERLIVNRPHPWGLLITFIELIKNPRYRFWSHSFTRCAPEIERLFESVARSCMSPPNQQQQQQQQAAGAQQQGQQTNQPSQQ